MFTPKFHPAQHTLLLDSQSLIFQPFFFFLLLASVVSLFTELNYPEAMVTAKKKKEKGLEARPKGFPGTGQTAMMQKEVSE